MTQGRKSRTVLAFGCALVALMSGALLAPALAGAQAADDEYNLTLPGAGGGEGSSGQSATASGSSSGSSSAGGSAAAPSSAGTVSASGDQTAGGAGGAGHGGASRDNQQGSGGTQKPDSNSTATNATETPAAVPAANPTDGGGVPILLIVLALVAAACTGVAIWRLRNRAEDGPGKVGAGADPASETQ
ncbi:MAG TPA: hypothetical protein VID76_02480 [Solirubrobacterales bacterium]|jgi:cobalamin biosynthesis Mg chelatase CobN